MSSKTVLVIEDDPDILELVHYNVEKAGFRVLSAVDGELGVKIAKEKRPAVILLDVMLPGIDGLAVCRTLRETPETRRVPIIMLTAKSEESDVIVGLEMGADDYVIKPFSPKELVARIRAQIRRDGASAEEARSIIECGPIRIDKERHEVYHNGRPLHLTLAEFKLLQTLASRPGRVFTREQLLHSITGGDTYVIDRNVDVHVRAIRKKLGDGAELIKTIRGVGYKCAE